MSTARAFEPSDGPTTPALLEQVHEPTGPGEADPQLALQHRGRAELAAHDELHGLAAAARRRRSSPEPLPPTLPPTSPSRRRRRCPRRPRRTSTSGAWRSQCPTTAWTSFSVTHAALDALGDARRGRAEQQHVALADEALGAGLVEDDPAVGEARHGEGEAGRDVGLDDAGDDVDRRALGGDHQVDADGAGHLGDAADRLLDVAGRHHHEVVELVDHDEDVRAGAGTRPAPRRVSGSTFELAAVERGVVAVDVADADLGEQVVATLHLLHRPGERVGRLLRVGDDLGEQVRAAGCTGPARPAWGR